MRQAIFDASSGDTINFATDVYQIRLASASGELLINKNLTIDGPGADKLAVRGGGSFRIFHIAPASVTATISGLVIATGRPPANESGGGILNEGTLTMDDCEISYNMTQGNNGNGAGVANDWLPDYYEQRHFQQLDFG